MTSEMKRPALLLVDDQRSALLVLSSVFSKDQTFDVYQASSAEEAIETARIVKPDIIISDYNMPDMNGIELCRYMKADSELCSSMFILLSVESSEAVKVEGLETGADDYAEKDLKTGVLVSKAKAFLRIKRLQDELKAQKEEIASARAHVERNFRELVSILTKIIDVIVPGAGDRAKFAKEAADFIGKKMGLDEETMKRISLGATLHEIGKVGLPDNLVSACTDTLPGADRQLFCHYPAIGSMIVSALSGFGAMAQDIYHELENYDGSGIPDGLNREEIGLGARINRAIISYEEQTAAGVSIDTIRDQILQRSNKIIDPLVASAFVEFLNARDLSVEDRVKLTVEDLKDGMVTASDIYSASGVKLLPKGTRLQGHMIGLLQERNRIDPIIGGVYVQRKA